MITSNHGGADMLVFRYLSCNLEHSYRVIRDSDDGMSLTEHGGSSQSYRIERFKQAGGTLRNRLTFGSNLTVSLPLLLILIIEILRCEIGVGAANKSDIQTSIISTTYDELPDIQASSSRGDAERYIGDVAAKTKQIDYAADICWSAPIDFHGGMRNVHRFLVLFSGHQGSSALTDMLSQIPEVIVPGFEPLEIEGMSTAKKWRFLRNAFNPPSTLQQHKKWAQELLSMPRIDRPLITDYARVSKASAIGFKMRPYVLNGQLSHTGASGIDARQMKKVLQRCNVTVILTTRRNRVLEALSWYRARELGINQFRAFHHQSKFGGHHNNSWAAPPADTIMSPRSHVNITLFEKWMRYTSNVNGKLEDAAMYFQRPTLRVDYEDFNQSPLETARGLLPSIGLPRSTHVCPSKFHKTGSDNVRDIVSNYDELCEYLDSVQSQYRCAAGGSIIATATRVSSKDLVAAARDSSGDGGGAAELGVDLAEASVSHGQGSLMMQRNLHQGKNKTTVVFKHIHKAGGTTLCRVAMENMRADRSSLPNMPNWGTNCVPREAFLHLGHPTGRDAVMDLSTAAGGAWLGGACFFGRLTLSQQKALPQHYFPLTFIASEGPLPDTMLTQPPYTLITMLRNPIDRTLSSYNWWRHMVEKFGHENAALCGLYSISNQKPTLMEWLREYPDNWMVRSFNGRSAFTASGKSRSLPVMSRENLAFAKERLELFSAVLIMERYEDSMAFLRELFSWKETAHSRLRSGSRFNSSAHSIALRSEAAKALESHNALDAELYDYALWLFERQRTAIRNLL